jgi:hypothetical protein
MINLVGIGVDRIFLYSIRADNGVVMFDSKKDEEKFKDYVLKLNKRIFHIEDKKDELDIVQVNLGIYFN